MRFKL